MGKPLIGYGNLVDDATLTNNNLWNASHPLSNLRLREMAQVARSTSATKIYLDHGAAVTARLVWIAAHNFQNGETVTVERGTSSGGSEVYAGSAVSAWPFTPLIGSRDGANYGIPIVMPAANSARYTTITIPAGRQIGRLFVGPAFDPTYGPTELTDDWRPPNSTITRASNGADWVHKRAEQRNAAMVFGALTYAEGALLDEIVLEHSITEEVVWIPDRDDRALSQRRGFLGTLRALSKLEYRFWQHQGTAIGIDERGGAP